VETFANAEKAFHRAKSARQVPLSQVASATEVLKFFVSGCDLGTYRASRATPSQVTAVASKRSGKAQHLHPLVRASRNSSP